MKRVLWTCLVGLALAGCRTQPATVYTPRDPQLRRPDLLLYPAARRASALIFFFGNDVGFWEPHRRLAQRLAKHGYDVAGLDTRAFLSHLPAGEPQRDRAFADSIVPLVAKVRREFGDTLPFILAGHSFGAEVAFWLARNHEPPGLVGILALSPRASGHLFVTPMDWAGKEPRGTGAWSTVTAARLIDPHVRIALVRGAKDGLSADDPAFVAAGGARLRRFVIPFAGHSLRRLLLAGPMIEHAIGYLLDGVAGQHERTLPVKPRKVA